MRDMYYIETSDFNNDVNRICKEIRKIVPDDTWNTGAKLEERPEYFKEAIICINPNTQPNTHGRVFWRRAAPRHDDIMYYKKIHNVSDKLDLI